MKTVVSGNTVNITAAFYELDGETIVAPDLVKLKVYDGRWKVLEERELSAGDDFKYSADYTIPPEASNPIYIEVEGIINGYPTLERRAVKARKVRDYCEG